MYGPGAVGRGEWYVYDAETGFPGLTIEGTACVGGGGDPLPLSESYEDIMGERAGRRQNAIEDLVRIDQRRLTRPVLERAVGRTAW